MYFSFYENYFVDSVDSIFFDSHCLETFLFIWYNNEIDWMTWQCLWHLSGEVPKNHDILREAYSLCYRLPVLNTPKFKEDFYNVSHTHGSRIVDKTN